MGRSLKREVRYNERLKQLKQKLKPYRDKETVHLLRPITGKSGVNLRRYFDCLESVLTGEHSHQIVKERLRSLVNTILRKGNFSKSTAVARPNPALEAVDESLKCLNVNCTANDDDVEINSPANVSDNARHVNINSRGSVYNLVRPSNIGSHTNVFENVRLGDIRLQAQQNTINRLTHLHIGDCTPACHERY